MDRFFVSPEQIDGQKIIINGPDVKHISGALRLDTGDSLEVVSQGYVYTCKIISLEKNEVLLGVLSKEKGKNEPRTKITLYQGLSKGHKMDFVIQKGTEVGITDFYAVSTKRSVAKINNDKKKKSKIERWQKIADESAKQAKRDIIPKINDAIDFDELIDTLKSQENIIIPYEEEKNNSIKTKLKGLKGKEISIVIGPEGGFSKDEINKLKEIGGKTVSLGPRILRTETAGIVASSLILYEFGDM